MNKSLDIMLREARRDKMAEEASHLITKFINDMTDPDPSDPSRVPTEFGDILCVWMQVAGSTVAMLEETTPDSWEDFVPLIKKQFEAGYMAGYEFHHGKYGV